MSCSSKELNDFLAGWLETSEGNKQAFIRLKDHLESQPGIGCEFHPREGITYSLRAILERQQERSLVMLLDVIEDEPRWLSICFYADIIDDPLEKGDFVPQGLLGEDALCFDLEEYEEKELGYIQQRMDEAVRNAGG